MFYSFNYLFKGIPITLDNKDKKNPPTRLPFIINLPNNKIEINKANILDYFSLDY